MRKPPESQTVDEWRTKHVGEKVSPIIAPAKTTPVCNEATGSSAAQLPNQHGPPQAMSDDETYSEPLIPAGKYKVVYHDHVTFVASRKGKLRIRFAICEGDYQGTILSGYYVCQLNGLPKKFGKIKVSKQGDYFDQMCNLFPDLADGRPDRISPQRLRGHTIIAEVSTVNKNWKGEERKPVTRYSKVSKMLTLADRS